MLDQDEADDDVTCNTSGFGFLSLDYSRYQANGSYHCALAIFSIAQLSHRSLLVYLIEFYVIVNITTTGVKDSIFQQLAIPDK